MRRSINQLRPLGQAQSNEHFTFHFLHFTGSLTIQQPLHFNVKMGALRVFFEGKTGEKCFEIGWLAWSDPNVFNEP